MCTLMCMINADEWLLELLNDAFMEKKPRIVLKLKGMFVYIFINKRVHKQLINDDCITFTGFSLPIII